MINPERPQALNLLGGIAEVRGNRQEAEDYYRAALDRDPGYDPARLNLAGLAGRSYPPRGIVWEPSDRKP